MRAFKILPVEMKVKHFNLSRDVLKRLYWMDWYFSHGKNAEVTCRHFNISKSVFYRWLPGFNKYNLTSLEFDTNLRKPHHLREMTTPKKVIDLIYQIRGDDLEKSKYEIQAELKDLHGVKIGYNTIQKVINRNPKLLNTFHKKKLKAHRKLKIARAVKYPSLFLPSSHTPKENSRAERLIQTVEYEFFNYQSDLLNDDLEEINRRCDQFNIKYNQKRYHHSLHYQTPSAYIKSYLEKGGQPFSIYMA